jgi:uncharacterized protein (TIGR02246 family)
MTLSSIKFVYNLTFTFLLISSAGFAQQQPDTEFNAHIKDPRFTKALSPVIAIDGMHNNLHKVNSNFTPFAKLAREDGYTVNGMKSWNNLNTTDILVIANAIDKKNMGNWQRPIYPAFQQDEIDKVKNYVSQGGSLLLIADHMPFSGATNELALAFGFNFCDGFAQLSEKEKNQEVFSLANSRLENSIITDGTLGTKIERVVSFTGSSFTAPKEAIGVLKFQQGDTCLKPKIAWQFDEDTKALDISGSYQGAIMEYGKGKIAVFGEAAMFTAQSIQQNGKTFKVGFNAAFAPQNVDFIRNVLYWLAKDLKLTQTQNNVEKEILEVNKLMEASFNNKGYETVSNFYTNDAVMIGCNPKDVIGLENIQSYWKQFSGKLRWKLENIEIKELGEGYALQRGYSTVYYKTSDGNESTSKSIFSLVWKKTNAGWKMMLDHFAGR